MKKLSKVVAFFVCVGSPAIAGAATLGANLVTNGNAETGDTTGFVTTGHFQVQAYNQGGFPGTGDAGVSDGGGFLFTGGDNDAFSTASQSIDLSSLATVLDTGTASFNLSALIGGFSSQEDYGTVQISFLGAGDTNLGGASIGPVTASDRGNASGLLGRSTTGFVPVGTRSVDLLLSATRLAGSYNDGYFDNVSLVVNAGAAGAVPEPATWAMMIGGLGLAGSVMRRRHRKSDQAVTVKVRSIAFDA